MKEKNNQRALLTDLYELTMAAAYFQQGMFEPATFSLFIRAYPPDRAYFVNAGLEEVLDFLDSFHFSSDAIEYLESTDMFSDDFLHYLSGLSFSGDVHAMPEGRIFFKDEPVLEVTGPIIEAQLVESFIINAVNLQVCIATKASRCVHAAGGLGLVDFSLRRTHGRDAALKVARASYIAGFQGTSNVLAGMHYGIPTSGTMAHSFVTSFEDEADAFRAFFETFPRSAVLLIDTYDTVSGAQKALKVAEEMREKGFALAGVRLDSGDMTELSKEVRDLLDRGGQGDAEIFASGGFDEFKIADALDRGARIDAFGVGTKMGVSADAPYTDIAYKLVKYDGRPVLKLSTGKKTLVDEKQVFRAYSEGMAVSDTITLRNEKGPGDPLLGPVMEGGRRVAPGDSLDTIRERFRQDFAALDPACKALKNPRAYPVHLGPELEALQERVVHEVIEKELGES